MEDGGIRLTSDVWQRRSVDCVIVFKLHSELPPCGATPIRPAKSKATIGLSDETQNRDVFSLCSLLFFFFLPLAAATSSERRSPHLVHFKKWCMISSASHNPNWNESGLQGGGRVVEGGRPGRGCAFNWLEPVVGPVSLCRLMICLQWLGLLVRSGLSTGEINNGVRLCSTTLELGRVQYSLWIWAEIKSGHTSSASLCSPNRSGDV